MEKHILIVDDEWNVPHVFGALRNAFEHHASFILTGCTSCEEAKELLRERAWFAVVLDLVFPTENAIQGKAFLSHIVKSQPGLPVIILTSTNTIEVAVDLMGKGAVDYVTKDVGANPGKLATDQLLIRLNRIAEGFASHKRIRRFYDPAAAGLRAPQQNLLSTTSTEQNRRRRKGNKGGEDNRGKIMPQFAGIRSKVFDCASHVGKTPLDTEFCLFSGELFLFRLQEKSQIGNWINPSDIPVGQDIATGLSECVLDREEDGDGVAWPATVPVLICHALNAVPDSMALYADIGRGFRMSRILAKAPRRVLLAGPNWACLNNGNQAAVTDNSELRRRVSVNLEQRLSLYARLHWDVSLFDIDGDLPPHAQCHCLDMSKIAQEREAVRDLLQHECGEFPVVAEDRKQLQQRLRRDLTAIESSAGESAALLATIYSCAEISCFLEPDVLTYFLAQAQATPGIGERFLKIAVESEQAFDRGIHRRARAISPQKQTPMGLYFPQYRAGAYTVLPYSSVSCDALNALSQGEDLDSVLRKTILLLHADGATDADCVADCLNMIPTFERARLLSDVLSFLHNMCYAGVVSIDDAYNNLLMVSSELGQSFEFYVSGESASIHSHSFRSKLLHWFASFDGSVFSAYSVPYHLIPYFWYEDEWRCYTPRIAKLFHWMIERTSSV